MLFLMAAGLTLVFGIMNLVNLAHGSLYMVGAYLAAAFAQWSGSFVLGVALALPATLLVGIAVEVIALRTLYERDHLDQVLATFGLILLFNELVSIVWGRAAIYTSVPPILGGHFRILPGVPYPTYRAGIIVVGILVSVLLWGLVTRTRLGMRIRAGASNRTMVSALGVNVRLLYTLVFGLGAALAGLAGAMAGPIYAVQPGMGETILIQVFVVIVIGGIRSIRGAGGGVGGGLGGPPRRWVPQADAGQGHLAARRRQGRARAGLDADLPADGGGAVLPAGGAVSGAEPLVTADRRRAVIVAVGGAV